MINAVREKAKAFLRETLEAEEIGEEVRIIGVEKSDDGWTVEAEVVERSHSLPQYRVFEKNHYIVQLTGDLVVSSYKQV